MLSHKQQAKRLQEDNQRLQTQMLATGERLEKMTHDGALDLKKEMLKLQRQLAGEFCLPAHQQGSVVLLRHRQSMGAVGSLHAVQCIV